MSRHHSSLLLCPSPCPRPSPTAQHAGFHQIAEGERRQAYVKKVIDVLKALVTSISDASDANVTRRRQDL